MCANAKTRREVVFSEDLAVIGSVPVGISRWIGNQTEFFVFPALEVRATVLEDTVVMSIVIYGSHAFFTRALAIKSAPPARSSDRGDGLCKQQPSHDD